MLTCTFWTLKKARIAQHHLLVFSRCWHIACRWSCYCRLSSDTMRRSCSTPECAPIELSYATRYLTLACFALIGYFEQFSRCVSSFAARECFERLSMPVWTKFASYSRGISRRLERHPSTVDVGGRQCALCPASACRRAGQT